MGGRLCGMMWGWRGFCVRRERRFLDLEGNLTGRFIIALFVGRGWMKRLFGWGGM